MIGNIEERRKELAELYPVWEGWTLSQMLDIATEKYPDNILIFDGDTTYSFTEITRRVKCLARNLYSIGIRPKMKIACLQDNTVDTIVLLFALSEIGAMRIHMNSKLHSQEIRTIMIGLDADYFVADDILAAQKENFIKNISFNSDLRLYKVTEADGNLDFEYVSSWNELMNENTECEYSENSDALSVCDICYTTGTTSNPKGVLLTHDMLLRSAYASCLNRGFEEGRRLMVPLPLFHVYGYVEGLLAAMLVGGGIIFERKYTPESTLRLIEKHKANDWLSIPSMMINILNRDDLGDYDLSSLHSVYCSASTCSDWLWNSIKEKLGVSDLITGYGMTETAGASMQTDPMDDTSVLCSKVGRLLSGGSSGKPEWQGHQMECRLVDPDTGRPCGDNEVGELWCRGFTVTDGYYNNPTVTAARISGDGWLKTGDLGIFDENGYFEFHGRMNDTYKFNGENVLTHYVEEIIRELDEIETVAVVGIPEAKYGEVGAAFVSLKPGKTISEDKIEEFCRFRLAGFQVPKYYRIIGARDWPLTHTGKIKKNVLKTMFAEG